MASEAGRGAEVPGTVSGFSSSGTAVGAATASSRARHRIPLRRDRRRLSYELRLRFWLLALTLPAVAMAAALVWVLSGSGLATGSVLIAVGLFYALANGRLLEYVTRPLQTLSNVVVALREDDFSFRARGARRGDALGDLALEINSLANTLQAQRTAARDAFTLAERVMSAMRTPVLAFSPEGRLQLLNPAAESAFLLTRASALGQTAAALGVESLLEQQDGAVYAQPAVSGVAGETRWSLRRSRFRLGGLPHELFVLSDVRHALREEERIAWQRLVRVLSHEINNSLTPITSIAGSLRTRLRQELRDTDAVAERAADLARGLQLIEERALSLHHFLSAYQQLTRLPQPMRRAVSLPALLAQVVALETRVAVGLVPGAPVVLNADPAQVEQLLINLLRNAAEAALSTASPERAAVSLGWAVVGQEVVVRVEDNGAGISDTANLFVPFYTTKAEGTGIGLALAKQIASGHGGSLTLANRPDAPGCVAELRLPLQ